MPRGASRLGHAHTHTRVPRRAVISKMLGVLVADGWLGPKREGIRVTT